MASAFSIFIKNIFHQKKDKAHAHEFADLLSCNRGSLEFDISNCNYCGKCKEVCPSDSILPDIKGNFLQHNTFNCIVCGRCVRSCPKSCIIIVPENFPPAFKRNNKVIR